MKVIRITEKNQERYLSQILELEGLATYPLGSDYFKIDHGIDYFAFFRRLGELYYYAVLDQDRVVAVAAGILRKINSTLSTWYICDLKVRPDYRGKHLPLFLLQRVFLPRYLQCRRAYAISMNSHDSGSNRVEKLSRKFRWVRVGRSSQLNLFSLDFETIQKLRPYLEKHRGSVSFLSLQGKKDLILNSTQSRLPILHLQYGPCAELGQTHPLPGYLHMFCAPSEDPLDLEIRAQGLQPMATATLIQHGFKRQAWEFIMTSDI